MSLSNWDRLNASSAPSEAGAQEADGPPSAIPRSLTRMKVVTDPSWAMDRIFELEGRVGVLEEALGAAVYFADNLQRVIDHKPVRDLAESRAHFELARKALSGGGGQHDE